MRLGVGLRQLALVAAAILALYPVWFMVSTAFKSQDQYLNDLYGFPWPLEGGNFSEARARRGVLHLDEEQRDPDRRLGRARDDRSPPWPRSPWRACAGAGRDVFLSINVALLIVPPVVMLIPLFTLFTQFSLVSTYWGVVILYAGLTLPFSVYLLSNFFRSLPRELFESAVMDKALAPEDSLDDRAAALRAGARDARSSSTRCGCGTSCSSRSCSSPTRASARSWWA